MHALLSVMTSVDRCRTTCTSKRVRRMTETAITEVELPETIGNGKSFVFW